MYIYYVAAFHTEYRQRTEAGSHPPGEAARSHPGTEEAGVESEDRAHLGPSWSLPFGGHITHFSEFRRLRLQRGGSWVRGSLMKNARAVL